MLEPNCGRGTFLKAVTEVFPDAGRILGIDINVNYVREAQSIKNSALEIVHGDFFAQDWNWYFQDKPAGPILVIGNPPWVTNAGLTRIGGLNIPQKTNFNGLSGIDAITGKSNFDISEWMLIKEVEALQGRDALLAMLCKTAIARKVANYAWKKSLIFTYAEIRKIDAQRHFGVAVDACLMLIRFHLDSDKADSPCLVFDSLSETKPSYILSLRKGNLVSQVDTVDKYSMLIDGNQSMFRWRSGIKHDCSKVMELKAASDGQLINGLGEIVDIESNLLFPMMKSSNLANGRTDSITRYMLVPQCNVGSDTAYIASSYPRTWKYLHGHTAFLNNRKSSVYHGKPRFSIFGVGEYAFEPWKVAISGLYKNLKFMAIGPFKGKPVVFDDTCYFLSFKNEEEALLIMTLLESELCTEILEAFIFRDSKRPVTKEILTLINLHGIAAILGLDDAFSKTFSNLLRQPRLF